MGKKSQIQSLEEALKKVGEMTITPCKDGAIDIYLRTNNNECAQVRLGSLGTEMPFIVVYTLTFEEYHSECINAAQDKETCVAHFPRAYHSPLE